MDRLAVDGVEQQHVVSDVEEGRPAAHPPASAGSTEGRIVTTHAVALIDRPRVSTVVCFDCGKEWAYFGQVDAARAAEAHRARTATP